MLLPPKCSILTNSYSFKAIFLKLYLSIYLSCDSALTFYIFWYSLTHTPNCEKKSGKVKSKIYFACIIIQFVGFRVPTQNSVTDVTDEGIHHPHVLINFFFFHSLRFFVPSFLFNSFRILSFFVSFFYSLNVLSFFWCSFFLSFFLSI